MSSSTWDTDIRVKGMKFLVQWDPKKMTVKLFGPRAPGHAWEGPEIISFKALDFSEAMRKSEFFVENNFK